MKQEKIEIYNTLYYDKDAFILLDLPDDVSDCEEIRNFQGFNKTLISYCCYRVDSTIILEACIYEYSINRNHRIFEIWDQNTCICTFFTSNQLDFLHLFERFISLRNNMVQSELSMIRIK